MILGLVLVLGSTLSGPGHVHAAPNPEKAGGLHVDHVHFSSNPGAHHTDPGPALEFNADHEGDDAVALNSASFETTPKRAMPSLADSVGDIEPPETPPFENYDRPRAKPRDPPLGTRPPGRAPPA
jgi:hypothetical protein